MASESILIVEDERSAAEYLRLLLEERGYRVEGVSNGVEALLSLERATPGLVLSDLRMPEMDGLELVTHVKQRWPDLPVIVITADADVSLVVEAVQHGAVNYLVKPAPPAAVLSAVERALASRTSSSETPRQIPELAGRSKAIVEVRHLVALAARSDVHVLITGATGTGKELVARAIHRHSNLAQGPFVAHNCALVPRELFESEFFGHRRGAFTGAERDHTGLMVRADGGVLFLDELETLALDHQAKLLRVLDDGEVRPVGSTEVRRVSVRFLAATNREAGRMIASRELREDLYYRLRGFEIRLPPLAARREDIPLLVAHFLGPDDPGVTPETMEALRRAEWPGNVRELRNCVVSARSAAGDAPIAVRHLSLERAPLHHAGPAPEGAGVHGTTLREIERDAIAQALRECKQNRTRAAQRLGIDRSTLRRKIHEFDLDDGGEH